jgi:hypothetical protein
MVCGIAYIATSAHHHRRFGVKFLTLNGASWPMVVSGRRFWVPDADSLDEKPVTKIQPPPPAKTVIRSIRIALIQYQINHYVYASCFKLTDYSVEAASTRLETAYLE